MTLVDNLYTASVIVPDDSLIFAAKGIFECDINTRLLLFPWACEAAQNVCRLAWQLDQLHHR